MRRNCSHAGVGVSAIMLCLLLVAASSAWGQTGTASLLGQVTDPQGAVIVGARVTITQQGTNIARTVTTDASGNYLFASLPPGKYNLRIEVDGFRTAIRDDLELPVNTASRLNIALELGEMTETVVVGAGAAPLNTTDASLGNVLTPSQVGSLPLEARNVMALLTLQPGVVFSGDPTDSRSGSVSGGRSDQANATLDGVDVNDQQTGASLTTSLPIPLASVQEFRFTTVNAGADQGRSSGGQVAFITKSGTNEFHGSLFWTHRNTATTANDFFNNRAGLPVPKLLRNQFGGSLGGRIIPDRLFFFGVYEGSRRREESNELRIGPTASMRDGVIIYRCEVAGDCPGGTVAGLTGSHAVPAGHRGLSPADIGVIDPLGLGVNPNMISFLGQYPACNDFTQGLDAIGSAPGLNFCGIRFNAPIGLDNNVWVAKFDFNITRDARHLVSWRGTLGDLSRDVLAAQMPGQLPRQKQLDNSKGFSARYIAQLSNNLTSAFTYGLTRQGLEFSGVRGDVFFIRDFSQLTPTTRALIRILPTHNIAEDATLVKGRHTWQFGINFRWIRNNRDDFSNAFALMGVNDGICIGLCNELIARVSDPAVLGAPAVAAAFGNPYKRSIMGLYGMITQLGTAAFFDGTQNVLAAGQAVSREFVANEYEYYVQDVIRVTNNLTFTLGVRYNLYGVPYEANGLQTQPVADVQTWFNLRRRAMKEGRPSADVPLLTWELGGPANDRPSFYRTDRNNFSPNVSFAYTPPFNDGLLARLFGGQGKSVIRGGFRIVNSRIGGAFVVTADQVGSVGLVTQLSNRTQILGPGPAGTTCTVPPTDPCPAPRFTGESSLPNVGNFVTVPAAGFPATPPESVSNRGFVIDNNLRTPYIYHMNLTYGRELPWDMGLEVSYVGTLGQKLLAKADIAAPLIYLIDPVSGQTFADAMNTMYLATDKLPFSQPGGLARLTSLQPIPHFENLFSGLVGFCVDADGNPCTATQTIYRFFSGAYPSFTDILIGLDFFGSDLGFPTYFQQQFDSLAAWTNLGRSNYHAMQVALRKRFSQGLLFDFNYTWSKSIDNASATENVARLTGQIADIFFPKNAYALSTFDLTHQMTANWVWELPFGRGRRLASDVHPVLNQIIGGWQTSGVVRWRGAFPTFLENGFNFPTNFFLTGPGTQVCPMRTGVVKNAPGGPNLFGGTDAEIDAAFACLDFTLTGSSGSRNTIRGAKFFNLDFGLRKHFGMPWEGHALVFDWQVFNLPNHPNFDDRTMRTNPESRGTFGRYVSTIGGDERSNNGRVMQFGLRYQF